MQTNQKHINTLQLWNPNAAASWSLLFTPVFGAWLHAKNWNELNKTEKAKKSMWWVYIDIVFLLVLPFLPDEVGGLPGILFILAWYFTSAKSQVKYIREHGIEYQKKSWLKPILAGITGLLVYVGIFSIMDSGDVGIVKNGTLAIDKNITIGQAFDNYSHFKNSEWQSFETENGRRIVQFDGEFKLPESDNLEFTRMVLIVQFTINKDDTFKVQAVEVRLTLKNGQEVKQPMASENLAQTLKSIYHNSRPWE